MWSQLYLNPGRSPSSIEDISQWSKANTKFSQGDTAIAGSF